MEYVIIFNFEHISKKFVVFLLLTLLTGVACKTTTHQTLNEETCFSHFNDDFAKCLC